MRIFCWNVNSLAPTVRNIHLRHGSLAAFFEQLQADIVCMQEVKLPLAKLTKDLVMVPGYQSYWACSEGKTGYSGVTTWVREEYAAATAEADPLQCEGIQQEGRCVVSEHGGFVLYNVYVPNAGDRPERPRLAAKLAFLTALKDSIASALAQGRQVVAVGDFNVAAEQRDVHSAITWETLYEQSELSALHSLQATLTDVWRHMHPDSEGVYTVWNERTSARAFNVGLRIDYALCSKQLLQHVKSCEILLDLPPKWSDHAPVLLELDVPPPAAAGAAEGSQQQPISCPMWRQLLKRFADPNQRSISAMFKAAKATGSRQSKQPATAVKDTSAQPPDTSAGSRKHSHNITDGPAAAAAAAAGVDETLPAAKRLRYGPAAAAASLPSHSAAPAAHADGAAAADDDDAAAAKQDASSTGGGANAITSTAAASSAAEWPADGQQVPIGGRQTGQLQPLQQQQQQSVAEQPPAAGWSGMQLPAAPDTAAGQSKPRTAASTESQSALARAGSGGGSSSSRRKQQQQQQQTGPKQSSLHAFFAKPRPA